MRHNPAEFLGVDVGSSKVGIARGSALARIAQPLKTVPAAAALAELRALTADNQVGGIVVGLPRSLQGDETAQTADIRDWVKKAQADFKLPFYWQDEALTSQAAAAHKPKNSHDEHALAAALILQDFLDTPETKRVRC